MCRSTRGTAYRISGESSRCLSFRTRLWCLIVYTVILTLLLTLAVAACVTLHTHAHGLEPSDLRTNRSVDDGVVGRTATSRWTKDVQLLGTSVAFGHLHIFIRPFPQLKCLMSCLPRWEPEAVILSSSLSSLHPLPLSSFSLPPQPSLPSSSPNVERCWLLQ